MKKKNQKLSVNIPERYLILPELLKLELDIFSSRSDDILLTLAPVSISIISWYENFERRILDCISKQLYLPVCRISDGEYRVLFGEQPPSRRIRGCASIRLWISYLRSRIHMAIWGFEGMAKGGVTAGQYSFADLRKIRPALFEGLTWILENGLCAAHLTFGRKPFQEHFHPVFNEWLMGRGLNLTMENYVPFYFVYALLAAFPKNQLLDGRKVGILHSAIGAKREAIVARLKAMGTTEVFWHEIDGRRSAFSRVEGEIFPKPVDLVFIGAGVGKLALFPRLSTLNCPVIDAGYMFEVWADPEKGRLRPFCGMEPEVQQKDSSK